MGEIAAACDFVSDGLKRPKKRKVKDEWEGGGSAIKFLTRSRTVEAEGVVRTLLLYRRHY